MNVIERVRDILQHFPKISQLVDEVHVDLTDHTPTSYGLSSIGDKKLSEDVVGTEERQHTFLFYAVYSGINDYERITNSGILLELALWLERQAGSQIEQSIGDERYMGEITEITTANGMLDSVPGENITDGIVYRLQIMAKYTLREDN